MNCNGGKAFIVRLKSLALLSAPCCYNPLAGQIDTVSCTYQQLLVGLLPVLWLSGCNYELKRKSGGARKPFKADMGDLRLYCTGSSAVFDGCMCRHVFTQQQSPLHSVHMP